MFNRDQRRLRPRRPIYTKVINDPLVDLQRMMIAKNGIGMGTQDGPIGGSGRVNTAWFRLGYTPAGGIPGMTPAPHPPSDQDQLGSADVNGACIEWRNSGEVQVVKFTDQDEWNFKAFNLNLGATPGNALTAFVRVLGLWMPLGAAPTGHFGIIVSEIKPRVAKKAGFGFVKIQQVSDDDGTIKDPDPLPDPPNVKTWNWAAATFAVGRYCWVEQDNTGRFFLVSCEC